MSSTDDLFDALERCAATSSKKGKLEIVKSLGDFQVWLRAALDTTVSYYVAKLPKYERHGTETLGDEDMLLLQRLANRTYSGNEALERIKDTMYELTPKSQEVLRRVLLQDLRCGVGASIVNDAFPGLIPVFPYQRCVLEKDSNMGKWNWQDGIIVQLKADGMFVNVDLDEDFNLAVRSRQGTPLCAGALADLEEALRGTLRPGTQTHGELTVYRGGVLMKRAEGNGVLDSVLQGGELPKDHVVRFDAWDQIPLACAVDKGRYEEPYVRRLGDLDEQIMAAGHELVRLVPTDTVHSREEGRRICLKYQAEGLEGVVYKHPYAIWRDGDNKDQVKEKVEFVVDLEVEEILPGDPGKRTEGRAGRITCSTSCGLLKVNVTVKNEKMRDALDADPQSWLGKVMPVKANGITDPTENNPLHSLYLPRFAEDTPRRDKSEADSLERVRAQFEAAIAA